MSAPFLIFDRDGAYTTEDGDPCTLGEHLDYLRTWGGTPDMWDAFETKAAAQSAADRAPFENWLIISENHDYRPIGGHTAPD